MFSLLTDKLPSDIKELVENYNHYGKNFNEFTIDSFYIDLYSRLAEIESAVICSEKIAKDSEKKLLAEIKQEREDIYLKLFLIHVARSANQKSYRQLLVEGQVASATTLSEVTPNKSSLSLSGDLSLSKSGNRLRSFSGGRGGKKHRNQKSFELIDLSLKQLEKKDLSQCTSAQRKEHCYEMQKKYQKLSNLLDEEATADYLWASNIELVLRQIPVTVFRREDKSVSESIDIVWEYQGNKEKLVKYGLELEDGLLKKIIKAKEESEAKMELMNKLTDAEKFQLSRKPAVNLALASIRKEFQRLGFADLSIQGVTTENGAIFIFTQGNNKYVVRTLSIPENLYDNNIDVRRARESLLQDNKAYRYTGRHYGEVELGREQQYFNVSFLQITEFFPSNLEKYAEELRANTQIANEDKAQRLLDIGKELIKMHAYFHRCRVAFPDTKPSNIMLRDPADPLSMVISDTKTMFTFEKNETIVHRDIATTTPGYENNKVRNAKGSYDLMMGAKVAIAVSLYQMATGVIPENKNGSGMHQFDFDVDIFKEEKGKQLAGLIAALADPSIKNEFAQIADATSMEEVHRIFDPSMTQPPPLPAPLLPDVAASSSSSSTRQSLRSATHSLSFFSTVTSPALPQTPPPSLPPTPKESAFLTPDGTPRENSSRRTNRFSLSSKLQRENSIGDLTSAGLRMSSSAKK